MNQIGNNLNSIKPTSSEGLGSLSGSKNQEDANGFKEALEKVKGSNDLASPQKMSAAKAPRTLQFSNHAVERMRSRGVFFSPDQLDKLESAHLKAKEKGAKETLVLSDKAALIINVKNNKVVTVMDKAALKDNVFTNIDSTVVI